jgi:hypothetical protein
LFDFVKQLGLDPSVLLTAMALSTAVFILAFRRFIVTLLEPLSMYVIILIADSTIVFALPWENWMKWEYAAFILSFWVGFSFRAKRVQTARRLTLQNDSVFDLLTILLLLFFVIVLGNLYLGISTGFPIFSDNPSESKVTALTGGLGLVKRINMGPYFFFCSGCTLMAVMGHQRRLVIFILTIATAFVVLGGSKSVLLPVIYVTSLAVCHKGLGGSSSLKTVKKYTLFGLIIAIGFALIVTTKDQGSLLGGISAFFARLLLSGDSILYYFPRREAIVNLVDPTFLGYLSNLFGDTLGFFRLADYKDALGSIILGNDSGFGPNVQYFIQADLFFNPIGGVFYSCFLGYLIASLRASFFYAKTSSAIGLTFRCVIALCALDIAVETGMFVGEIVTMAVVILPLWLVARGIRSVLYSISSIPPKSQPQVQS